MLRGQRCHRTGRTHPSFLAGGMLYAKTSNILFVNKGKIYSPINNIYKGITFQFFEKKLGNIIKKNILIKSLNNFEEIILIGSGKGVVSVKSIKKPDWTDAHAMLRWQSADKKFRIEASFNGIFSEKYPSNFLIRSSLNL